MEDSWNELPFGSSGRIYEPLPQNHIRLVKLEDIVCGIPQCTLATFSCDPVPKYITISYTWGSPENVKFP